MKTPFKIVLGVALSAFSFSCSTDDEQVISPPPVADQPAVVSFTGDHSFNENSGSAEITISFSKPALKSGTIVIKQNGNQDGFLTTVPAAVNYELQIPVEAGAQQAVFSVLSIDNGQLDGHRTVFFELKEVSEGLSIGIYDVMTVRLLDDELTGKPRSWETHSGIWRNKKTYEYDTQGRVSKINWEQNNPDLSSGTDTYVYDNDGNISYISYSQDHRKLFFWEQGKIIRSEEMQSGIKKRYQEYTYNEAGHVHSATFYHRTASGDYVGSTIVYEYNPDGNLKKEIQYSTTDVNGYIYSRRSYDNYLDKTNPFPMVDLLPNMKSQLKLPGSVRIQENAMDLNYNLIYQYDTEGRVIRRTTNGESTTYTYY